MGVSSYHFAFWNKFTKFCDGREQHLLVCTLEVLVLLSVKECNKVWNGCHTKCLAAISSHGGIYSHKYQVGVVIRLGSALKSWFDPHARGTCWAPEIYD